MEQTGAVCFVVIVTLAAIHGVNEYVFLLAVVLLGNYS